MKLVGCKMMPPVLLRALDWEPGCTSTWDSPGPDFWMSETMRRRVLRSVPQPCKASESGTVANQAKPLVNLRIWEQQARVLKASPAPKACPLWIYAGLAVRTEDQLLDVGIEASGAASRLPQ